MTIRVLPRLLIGVAGVAMAAYGGWLLLAEGRDSWAELLAIALWLVAGVVLHDFVLVPLTLALGYLAARLLPAGLRAPVVAGLVVLGTLTLMAVPVLGRFGERPDNPTVLDRDYTAGWLAVAGVIGLVVLLAAWIRQAGPRRDVPPDG
jgi:hypothetical protein